MQIAAIAGEEFANAAKRELHSEKHSYTMGRYLQLLDELKDAILKGIDPMVALASMRTEIGTIRLHAIMDFLHHEELKAK